MRPNRDAEPATLESGSPAQPGNTNLSYRIGADPRRKLPRNDPDHQAWKQSAIQEARRAARAMASLARSDVFVATPGVGGPCIYCGAPATDYDHVWPRARGGTDNSFNLVRACAECNNRKGSKSILTDSCPGCGRAHDPSDVDCSNGTAFYACRCGRSWSKVWDLQHPVWLRPRKVA